jgi:hypothetical protein
MKLEDLIKLLALLNGMRPIIEGAINNEAAARGLSRADLNALTKKLTSETADITTEDMSDRT